MKEALLQVKRELVQNGKTIGMTVEWENIYGWGPRVNARIVRDVVTIRRLYGPIGKGEVILSLSELAELDTVCQHWENNRETWAAFCFRVGGFPFGGGHWIFREAGKNSEVTQIGHQSMLSSGGKRFKNKDIQKPLEIPGERGGVMQIAELWRYGEEFGNTHGEKVGEVFQINDKKIELKRYDLTVNHSSDFFALEPDYQEERFVHELVLLMQNQTK